MYIKDAVPSPLQGDEIYDGAYSLMVKLFSVAEAIRVRFPVGTLPLQELEPIFSFQPRVALES